MANIHLKQAHNKSEPELRKIAEELAEKLAREFKLKSKWNGNTLDFKRSGLHGSLILNETEVSISLKLGIMMSTFSSRIKKELAQALKDTLI